MSSRKQNRARARENDIHQKLRRWSAIVPVSISLVACSSTKDAPAPEPDASTTTGSIPDAGSSDEPTVDASEAGTVATKFSRPSRGSTVDVSEDDAILAAVNPDVGTVTVFDVTYDDAGTPTLTKKAEVAVGGEPRQLVLSPSGDRAYVVCRKDQKVVRIDGLRSTPVKGAEIAVGSEPTGLALTPKATSLWVANWVDGTVVEIDAELMAITSTIDLNATLAASGMLGPGLAARPALAHPRSIAITNNKDDVEMDESVFVTEFFSQQKEPLAADGSNADVARQGVVYRIALRDKSVKIITLPPLTDIGFHDHTDKPAGCFPNQLQSIDVQGSFAYVLSICASPKGPLGSFTGPAKPACTDDSTCPGAAAGSCDTTAGACKTNCTTNDQCGLNGVCTANVCVENFNDVKTTQTPAVSVIDIGADSVIASVGLNLEFNKLFDSLMLPDTSARRYPLNSTALAFLPGTLTAYIAANGADALYRVEFNATYETRAVDSVGSTGAPFISLNRGTLDASLAGKLPTGVAMTHKTHAGDAAAQLAFVTNEGTRNLTVIDTKKDDIVGIPDSPVVVPLTAMPQDDTQKAQLTGKTLFSTGLGRWSYNGQAWAACTTCHWDSLSDQVTWFHVRGARQSPSLDGTFSSLPDHAIRVMNWNGIVDEMEDHESGALRTIAGGIGAIIKSTDLALSSRIAFDKNGHAGLNGSAHAAADPTSPSSVVTDVCVVDDWAKITVFEQNLRTPRHPSNLDPAKVAMGKDLFTGANCQGCHGGDMWTIAKRFYTPDSAVTSATNTNKVLKTLSWTDAVGAAGFPAALLPTTVDTAQTMRYNGTKAADLDSLTCLLRPVGTFNVAEPGVGVAELRRNMTAVAQGDEDTGRGYNVPGLLGLSVGAPYLHAGNARTLEALFSDTFAAHHTALAAGFLGAGDPDAASKRDALIQYLLSIDEDTPAIDIPALGPTGGSFCATP